MGTPSATEAEVRERLSEATLAAKSGDFEQAILQLKSILAKASGNEVAWGMLAATYAQIGMTERALDGYARVLEINPDNTLARFQLGLTLLMASRPQEALDAWQRCLTDDDFMAHFHSGLALLQLGKPAEAQPLLRTAAQRAPKGHPLQPEIQRLLASVNS